MKVQEASASLMRFLVQDFLDYSQIKSGKFRINIKSFDVRLTVEKVMSIQRKKAQDQKLAFTVEYVNIKALPSSEASDSRSSYS